MVSVSGKISLSEENEKRHQLHIGTGKNAGDYIKRFSQITSLLKSSRITYHVFLRFWILFHQPQLKMNPNAIRSFQSITK